MDLLLIMAPVMAIGITGIMALIAWLDERRARRE